MFNYIRKWEEAITIRKVCNMPVAKILFVYVFTCMIASIFVIALEVINSFLRNSLNKDLNSFALANNLFAFAIYAQLNCLLLIGILLKSIPLVRIVFMCTAVSMMGFIGADIINTIHYEVNHNAHRLQIDLCFFFANIVFFFETLLVFGTLRVWKEQKKERILVYRGKISQKTPNMV